MEPCDAFPGVYRSSHRLMRIARVIACSAILAMGAAEPCLHSQSSAGDPGALFTVAVDEVSLTFHATDAAGHSVNNLAPGDLTIYDNLKRPGKILAFQLLHDQPVHAAILLDTSESMLEASTRSRDIATDFVREHLRAGADQVLIEDFGYVSRILQPWSGDSEVLAAGVTQALPGRANPRGGTALFEAVYSTCLYQFGDANHPASGNVILLFTDGEDNASRVDLESTIDQCQRANVAVYVFSPEAQGSSTGPGKLSRLTAGTGGRWFHLDESEAEASSDLSRVVSEARDRYWLVYRPADLKHDGSFHSIYVGASKPDVTVDVRAGYYAPGR
jgi:Ca-activated chloride channel homolog